MNLKEQGIKNWFGDFKNKEGRIPSLREMKEDPEMAQLLESL